MDEVGRERQPEGRSDPSPDGGYAQPARTNSLSIGFCSGGFFRLLFLCTASRLSRAPSGRLLSSAVVIPVLTVRPCRAAAHSSESLSSCRPNNPCIRSPPPSQYAGYDDDLFSFNIDTKVWTSLSYAKDSTWPSGRSSHGFTSAGGKLYVHGGYNTEGWWY